MSQERGARSPRQCPLVLPDMDAIGTERQRKVGSVVQDEGNVRVPTHGRHSRPRAQDPSCIELLVTELDDVDAALDGCCDEGIEVWAVWGAQVERSTREVHHVAALAACFMAALNARTASRLAGSTMSATDRCEPGSE